MSNRTKEHGEPVFRRIQQTLRAILPQIEARPDRLADILAAAPEALLAFDVHRRVLHANARAEALFGYGPAELDGRSTDELIPERLRQPDAPPMTATIDLMQVELPGLMRDGRERDIEWCFGAVRSPEAVIFVMTVRDRQELDRAMEALRSSEERFQLLINGLRDWAIFMLDADARILSWNEGAARIKGWKTEEILGQPYEVFFTPEDRAAGLPAAMVAGAIANGSREAMGWRVRKDGTRFWAHASLTALRDADGKIRGFAKITRDLTERRNAEENERRLIIERAAREAAQEAEQRLRASEERLRRLQRLTAALSDSLAPENVAAVVLEEFAGGHGASHGAVYLLAEDGATLQMLAQRGHSEAALARYRSIPLDARIPISDAARGRAPVYFDSLETLWTQYPGMRESLGPGSFQAAVALPLVARGVLVGALSLRFDQRRAFDAGDRALVSTIGELCSQALERARLFKAESLARAAAESASRAKDEFLAMLGHELRNPLAPIKTAVQLMKLRGDEHSTREREIIARQASHLSGLVDDLLDVSRVARGLVSLTRTAISAKDVLSRAVEMASPLLEQRAQHLVLSVPDAHLWMNADPLRLAQVVANLLSNAAKFTPPQGHVWLSAALEAGRVAIRVRDDGEGIAPDLLPKVFDLFVQGAPVAERSGGGLGLGLALVKSFVALHGGTVTASSDGPGRGSEFVVRIPAIAAAERTAAGPPARPRWASAHGQRVLVVDDNEDAGETVAELLREFGHEVCVAYDGPSALARLREFPADVAILDLGLPVMDGFELARRVREQQADHPPRLIALTGYGLDRDLEKTRAGGFDEHLVKPVDEDALLSAVANDQPQDDRTLKASFPR